MSPEVTSATWISLKVAFWAATLVLPLATWLAHLLVRRQSFWLEALLFLPLVFPPVVVGYLLLVLIAPRAPLGSLLEQWDMRLVLTWQGAVLAGVVVALPLAVQAIRVGMESGGESLEPAAATLGGSRAFVWWTVTLPRARGGLLAGWLLAFSRALGEFGATILVAGNIPGLTQTLPLAIYTAIETGRDALAARLVAIIVILAVVAVVILRLAERGQQKSP